MKNLIKTFLAIAGLNLIENLILLLFFGVDITKKTFLGALVFTIVLTLILNKLKVLEG